MDYVEKNISYFISFHYFFDFFDLKIAVILTFSFLIIPQNKFWFLENFTLLR